MNCFIIAALTADGLIGRDKDHNSTRWTSKEDAAWFNQRSKKAGIVVMGRTTYETISRPLPGRVTIVYSRQADKDKLVENQTHLEKGEVYYTQAEPKELLRQLIELEFTEVAICGGASIYTMFMKAGLVSQLYLTVEPVLFGQGINLFTESLDIKLKLEDIKSLSKQTKLLVYSLE